MISIYDVYIADSKIMRRSITHFFTYNIQNLTITHNWSAAALFQMSEDKLCRMMWVFDWYRNTDTIVLSIWLIQKYRYNSPGYNFCFWLIPCWESGGDGLPWVRPWALVFVFFVFVYCICICVLYLYLCIWLILWRECGGGGSPGAKPWVRCRLRWSLCCPLVPPWSHQCPAI